ncbi:unnamed protein product [Eruca vesicaria subsp. sativa]|uniref:Uncharacterized protein n=1 Tax=Eruca vesicaria subsp. sativa TaxID=29727 RepID=A0ABC8JLE7_ERUVS|nr:unnamed protein product [Eruca vesicaria subsp. sativa]
MAFNRDLKLKSPMVEKSGSSLEEAFTNGMSECREHFRAMLFMCKQQLEATIAKHAEEVEVYRVQGKLELLEELFSVEVVRSEKEKLESKLVLARANMDIVKVPYIDWFKLGEPQMFD